MSEEIDLMEDAKSKEASEDTLEKIREGAKEMMHLKERIEKGEELLKELGAKYRQYETEILPSLMEEADMELFEAGGFEYKIKPILKASLPSQGAIDKAKGEKKFELKERLDNAINWLEENGAGDIVKRQVHADIGKDEEKAKLVAEALAELGVPAKRTRSVHGATLSSYIKEKISEPNVEVDFELFGVFSGKVVQVKKLK